MKKIIAILFLVASLSIPAHVFAADPPEIVSLEGAESFGGGTSYPDAENAFYPSQWIPYELNVTTVPEDANVSFDIVRMEYDENGIVVPTASQANIGAAISSNNEFYFFGGDSSVYLLKVTAEANGLSTTKNYYAFCAEGLFPTKEVAVGSSIDLAYSTPFESATMSYSTADSSIAQIDSNGILTGITTGSTNYLITQTYQGIDYSSSYPSTVNVTPAIVNPPTISVIDNSITYPLDATTSESQFLSDIGATTDDGSTITSDFSSAVNFDQTGVYIVTLNSTNSDGISATPVQVNVHIEKSVPPVITADNEITYEKASSVTEAEFLADIHASTNDGSSILSDFNTAVNLNKTGDYQVTLNATNSDGTPATPVQVTVHVTATETTVISADKEITYKQNTAKSESQFLADIHAKTNNGSKITSDFNQVVNLDKAGDYRVKLVSEAASPVYVTVHVTKSTPIKPDKPDKPSPNTPSDIKTGKAATKTSQPALPATGDSANNILFALAGAFLIAGSLLRRK